LETKSPAPLVREGEKEKRIRKIEKSLLNCNFDILSKAQTHKKTNKLSG
jgi:hypothetical protein